MYSCKNILLMAIDSSPLLSEKEKCYYSETLSCVKDKFVNIRISPAGALRYLIRPLDRRLLNNSEVDIYWLNLYDKIRYNLNLGIFSLEVYKYHLYFRWYTISLKEFKQIFEQVQNRNFETHRPLGLTLLKQNNKFFVFDYGKITWEEFENMLLQIKTFHDSIWGENE